MRSYLLRALSCAFAVMIIGAGTTGCGGSSSGDSTASTADASPDGIELGAGLRLAAVPEGYELDSGEGHEGVEFFRFFNDEGATLSIGRWRKGAERLSLEGTPSTVGGIAVFESVIGDEIRIWYGLVLLRGRPGSGLPGVSDESFELGAARTLIF